MQRIAIVGAGIAGATLANELVQAGRQVSVFEKSRGTGGRLASARLEQSSGDLGTDLLIPRTEGFRSFLESLEQEGVCARWSTERTDFNHRPLEPLECWVGVGRNSQITRHLLNGSELISSTRVGVIWPDREGVLLRDDQGEPLGHFDAVICAAPAPQAQPLLECKSRFAETAARAKTTASWVLLAELKHMPERLESVGRVEGQHSAIEQITVDSSKPGRQGSVIKVQMRPDWTQEYLELHPETVEQEIISELSNWLGSPVESGRTRVHRWLYTNSHQPYPEDTALWDSSTGVGACGDWIAEPGYEGSWLSAKRLANQILAREQSAA